MFLEVTESDKAVCKKEQLQMLSTLRTGLEAHWTGGFTCFFSSLVNGTEMCMRRAGKHQMKEMFFMSGPDKS